MSFDLRVCSLEDVRELCVQHHGYGSAGGVSTYCFGVYEADKLVAAYSWQPPPPGAAKSVCPEAPYGVLALSRMVAVPKEARTLKHVSRPLRQQMKSIIDRTRWPVLVTYSDEGQGHSGYVYKCSGWTPTARARRSVFELNGKRASMYANGSSIHREGLTRNGSTWVQRWEHWFCAKGLADVWMKAWGWRRVAKPGQVWKSGNPAFTIAQVA